MVALAAAATVLGFGGVALQLANDGLSRANERVERDEASLHAELAASEAVSRVIEGEQGSFGGSGLVDGVEYRYDVIATSTNTWEITGRAGEGINERRVDVELRREISDDDVGPSSGERYAVWTEDLLLIGELGSGQLEGSVGSRNRIEHWYSQSIGSSQDYVSGGFCFNCPRPQVIDEYETLPLPNAAGAAPCPGGRNYRITGPVTLSGKYLCDSSSRTLRLSGRIDTDGPVEIHVGDNTRLDIRDAVINDGGHSSEFVIAKPTSTGWAERAAIDDTTFYGRILAPETRMYVGDLTWRGTFEVGSWQALDGANIDGAWDDVGSGTEPTLSWHIDLWQLS